MSQSTGLFEDLKLKLANLFKKNLSDESLNGILHEYHQLLANYENLFDKVKSKVKTRKVKYEVYLQLWREFDSNCKHLENVFKLNDPTSITNLEFRSLVVDINDLLNKLKEHHGTLTSICAEKKYFDMKDVIILYELKLKKFKEDYEAKSMLAKSLHIRDNYASDDITSNQVHLKLNVLDRSGKKVNLKPSQTWVFEKISKIHNYT